MRDVLHQPLAGQPQKEEAETRVLEIELLHLLVADAHNLAGLDAFETLRALVPGREQPELADQAADGNFDARLDQTEIAAHDVEHLVGRIALMEQDVAGLAALLVHVGLQPIHVEVAGGGGLHLLDQFEHLIEAQRVERDQDQIEKEGRIRRVEEGVADQEEVAGDTHDAKGHHRFGRIGREIETSADDAEDVRETDPAVIHAVLRLALAT